jgi:hypothetical protein
MSKPSIPQGTRDFSAATVRKRNYILNTIASCDKTGNMQIEFPGETGKKPIFVYFNASDKVMDSKTLKNVNSVSGYTEKFVVFFVQTSF